MYVCMGIQSCYAHPPQSSHKETLPGLDIDLFTNIYVGRIEKMVMDFKMNRCVLGFDIHFLGLLGKKNNKITYMY